MFGASFRRALFASHPCACARTEIAARACARIEIDVAVPRTPVKFVAPGSGAFLEGSLVRRFRIFVDRPRAMTCCARAGPAPENGTPESVAPESVALESGALGRLLCPAGMATVARLVAAESGRIGWGFGLPPIDEKTAAARICVIAPEPARPWDDRAETNLVGEVFYPAREIDILRNAHIINLVAPPRDGHDGRDGRD